MVFWRTLSPTGNLYLFWTLIGLLILLFLIISVVDQLLCLASLSCWTKLGPSFSCWMHGFIFESRILCDLWHFQCFILFVIFNTDDSRFLHLNFFPAHADTNIYFKSSKDWMNKNIFVSWHHDFNHTVKTFSMCLTLWESMFDLEENIKSSVCFWLIGDEWCKWVVFS